MVSKKETVRQKVLEDPTISNAELARIVGCSMNNLREIKRFLRREGALPEYVAPIRTAPETKIAVESPPTPAPARPFEAPIDVKAQIRQAFKKFGTHTLENLAESFDTAIGTVKVAIEEMIEEGHNYRIDNGTVIFSNIIPKSEPRHLDVRKMTTGFYKFGVTGDNHLCSKYQRLDVLNALYDLYENEGITTVFNTGNWIDGEAKFNRHDLLRHGLDLQVDYFLEHYPQRKGIITHYITGDDHEGWYTQREGIDVGKHALRRAKELGRADLVYLGHMEADVILKAPEGQTVIRILHPGGGSAYAISYTSQKIVESYTGGEKPDILFDGHYHKAGYNYIRGVHVVQTACTQDQTPFMRKKKLAAHLGGWIIEFGTDDVGAVTRFKQEFVPFYDNAYYSKWAYKWK